MADTLAANQGQVIMPSAETNASGLIHKALYLDTITLALQAHKHLFTATHIDNGRLIISKIDISNSGYGNAVVANAPTFGIDLVNGLHSVYY